MKTLTYILTFALGAAAGVAASFGYAKKKYEEKTQDELDSLRETYRKMVDIHEKAVEKSADEIKEKVEDVIENKITRTAYNALAKEYSRGSFHKEDIFDEEEDSGDEQGGYVIVPQETFEERKNSVPYIISSEELGEYNGEPFDTLELIAFRDNIIVDDAYDIIQSVEGSIGSDIYTRLIKGEFDDQDVIHIRNRRLRLDYELVRDPRTYDEFIQRNPYLTDNNAEMEEWAEHMSEVMSGGEDE